MRKHLIFHFCVNQKTGWAKAHIDRLKQHIDLFETCKSGFVRRKLPFEIITLNLKYTVVYDL